MRSKSADGVAIRRLMARIRRDRHEDISELLVGAESVAGLGRHPGAMAIAALCAVAAAAAAAVYFTAVGRKGGAAMRLAEQASGRLAVGAGRRAISSLTAFIGRIAARAAQNYLAHYVENWITPSNAAAIASSVYRRSAPPVRCEPPGDPAAGSDPGHPSLAGSEGCQDARQRAAE